MLVGTILNKHAHNFAEFFHARNGTTFAGYAEIHDNVHELGSALRTQDSLATSTLSPVEIKREWRQEGGMNITLKDDHHGEFDYPLVPVLATLTLLVGK